MCKTAFCRRKSCLWKGVERVLCWDSLQPIDAAAGTAVALGYFDGVHLGHRAVLSAAVQDAAAHGLIPAAFTFALPPHGGHKGQRILSEAEKRRRMETLGIQIYLCPPFEDFCALSPQQFVFDVLRDAYKAKAVFCGENFTFGKNRAGNVGLLKELCAQAGIRAVSVSMEQYAHGNISSTRIRRHLDSGDIEGANAMLGADYSIELPILHGKGLGRTLGYPTINQVYPEGMLIPKTGVYITEVTLPDGSRWPGATGLGTRPTVSNGGTAITCETFMPTFQGNVYGQTAQVRFCKYLWPTQTFSSQEELASMISRAARLSMEYFGAAQA
jgi:riboflavin kinase/FMN adenylyltransferase